MPQQVAKLRLVLYWVHCASSNSARPKQAAQCDADTALVSRPVYVLLPCLAVRLFRQLQPYTAAEAAS